MEGWRQRRPGSSAKESTEGKTKTEREKHSYRKEGRKTFLTLTGLLMEGVSYFFQGIWRPRITSGWPTNYPQSAPNRVTL
jgi:hypothetical protein